MSDIFIINDIENLRLKNLTGGCVLSKEHPLDYQYSIVSSAEKGSIVTTTFPNNFRLWTSGIKNQQTKNTCVAHALATLKETQEYYDTKDTKLFSTNWIYGNRTNEQYQGDGMYIREALSNLKNYGAVYFEDMPDNLDYKDAVNLISDRKDSLLEKAQNHKIKSYAVPTSVDEMKSALYNDKSPIVIGFTVYDSFYDIDNIGIAPIPNTKTETAYGGHAVLIIGWTIINNKEYWVVQNSWGDYWGDNGCFYIGINDNFPIYEKWCSVDITNNDINFEDIKNRWSEKYINSCIRAGLISGFEDGLFRPTDYITREQLCTIIAKMLEKI